MDLTDLHARLKVGDFVLLDGATGTELERRGVPMNDDAWCALATEAGPDTLRQVHEDYIRAGADVIIANTYASSRNMLGPAGMGDKVEPLNRRAVEIALEARSRAANGRPVAVAGSMSHMMPMVAGEARNRPDALPSDEQFLANAREMAGILKTAGVDLIVLEMMSRPSQIRLLVEAARETGLPVWIGFSARQDDDGKVVSFCWESFPFEDVVAAAIEAGGGEVMGIMHTNPHIVGPALDILRRQWDGPMMAYPDSGYFKMPQWQFGDIIPPDALVAQARGWIAQGTTAVGGCCGIGVEHIRALAAAFRPSG
jgi:S-methylmethionine-dependent homocysteine/selenocysteine methylase